MSCFSELKLTVYLDGELSPDELRPLEAHLVTCQSCRALVVSLREEAELLIDVLQEREVQVPERAARAAPARGFAIGLLPALVGVITVTSIFSWLVESGASSLDWLNPLRLRGAIQMSFDFVFMLRDQAPALFQLAFAMAALASVSAILTYAVTALSRRWLGGASLAVACLLLAGAPETSSAHFGLHEHPDILVKAGEVHEGTLVTMRGENIDIDGVVTGDLIVTAHRLTIRGEVRGNVFVLAQDIDLSGVVAGSVHSGGVRTIVSGSVGENLYVLTENFTLTASGKVGSDLWMRATGAAIEGSVGRDLYAGGRWIELRGTVARNMTATDLRVSVMQGARIGGDLEAELKRGEQVDLSPDAEIGGELRTSELSYGHPTDFSRFLEGGFYLWLGLRLAAAFLVGLLLHALAPWVFGGHLETASEFFRCMGVGLAVLLGAPIALGLVFCTLVGIPIAVIGGAAYATALYCAMILLAALIGSAILQPGSESTGAFGLPLLLGLVVVLLAVSLPFVGGPIRLIGLLTGLGLLFDRGSRMWRGQHAPA
jgi:cytoskeletal protein CcmA (bactofilin family)